MSQDFELLGRPSYVRGDYSYVGGFYNNLQETGVEAGDYHQLNMKMGMRFNEAIDVDFSVSNLTDSDALTWVNTVIPQDARAYRLRPRTVSLQVTWTY